MVDVSIVIPMKNEGPNVGPLLQDILAACDGLAPFEVIVVDDGSTDDTPQILARLAAEDP
ncbi:MAG: glycosyltransferase, partial [Pseudomonadota bacterium]